jgi:aldehyde dehydrogenase (NAD+)
MFTALLQNQQVFYNQGATRTYAFRIAQLKKLKHALVANEQAIYAALQLDLGKGQVEAYATELGLVLAELNLHIKKLKKWLRPHSTGINIVNLPSSSKVYYEPLGVVLIIGPWNYPLQLIMKPLIGAISGGNCAVLKPSEYTPATTALIEKIIGANYPVNYITTITGNGAEVVPALMNNFTFAHVFFTGSTAVGKAIYELAAKRLVPVTLELGGKSPTIVCADANIKVAAKRIAFGKWLNAGQTCIAPDYVLVHEGVKDSFITAIKECITTFYGDAKTSTDYSKIIHEKRFDTLVKYIEDGHVIAGGNYDKAALFIAPTLLDGAALDADVMCNEIFGPVLPIISFKTHDEALTIVNKNSNPLAFYLFTSNTATQKWWMEQVSFGGGCINNTVYHFANDFMPFGGIGNSGLGSYHGKHSFYTFTHAKPVLKTPTWFEPGFKYPPFNAFSLRLFKKLIR